MITSDIPTSDTSFYEPRLAARLARIPSSTLASWTAEGVTTPSRELIDAQGELLARGFSFSDVTYLRILRHLREQGVPMEYAITALVHLQERFGPPSSRWKDAKVFVHGKRIFAFQPDGWETTLATESGGGQRIEETLFGDLFQDLRDRTDSILIPNQFLDYVEINPAVADGLPVVKGTRIPTSTVREVSGDGRVKGRTLREHFSSLSPRQIESALRFEEYLDRGLERAA